jgi:acyl-CoA reductase-like NAD-dependent aldehyde dehydrogenase
MPESTIKVTAPYDGHMIQEIPLTSWEKLDGILDASYAIFHDRSKRMLKHERIKILNRFRELLVENMDSLARQAAEEGGKPLVDSLIEVRRAVNGIEIAVQELGQMRGTEIPMELTASSVNHIAYTMLEPAGVVVAISAFNHPVNLIIHQVVPALAVGCPVIVKPAAATPLSCFSLVELLNKAGLPEEWCRAVVCDREASARLASDSRIKFVSFIGSAKVGWNLRKNLAPGVNCALEHGGAAPVIVEPDVNIDNVLPGIVKGGYYHAGQVCVSVQRLYVHKDIMPAVKDKMTEMVKALKVGDPMDMSTEVGPLIKPGEVDRVEKWVKEAIDDGAKLLCGGSRISDTCYEPTILLNPPEKSKVSTEEVFGPVVCLYEYDHYLDAVKSANNVPFNFQASIYTENLNTALDCAKRLKGKAVMVNEHTAFRVDWMPFGGAEMSGLGTGGIGYSMRDMCHEKMIVIKSSSV